MTTLDETPDTAVAERQTGAQTVAPTSASALLFAASILGEASYTPEAELKRSLEGARAHEAVAEPVVAEPVAEPVAAEPAPVAPVTQPKVETSRPSVVPPARVETRVEATPVAEPVTKGWFARFLDKLFGRG